MPEHMVDGTNGTHRRNLAMQARFMIASSMNIVEEDENALMTTYNDFFVLFSFSEVHPLIMISLVRKIDDMGKKAIEVCNRMNLSSVLGSHAINDDAACYTYRSAHWLDAELNKPRFFEILNRCVDEASRCFQMIA